MNRRQFLRDAAAAGLILTPLAAALGGCKDDSAWPAGMVAINWDRDPCTKCGMVISDRRFACEVHGGPKSEHFKFDDIGCAVTWLQNTSWSNDPAMQFWVADVTGKGERWLDARTARYVGGRPSPMGYNHGAVEHSETPSLDFEDMRKLLLSKEG